MRWIDLICVFTVGVMLGVWLATPFYVEFRLEHTCLRRGGIYASGECYKSLGERLP